MGGRAGSDVGDSRGAGRWVAPGEGRCELPGRVFGGIGGKGSGLVLLNSGIGGAASV